MNATEEELALFDPRHGKSGRSLPENPLAVDLEVLRVFAKSNTLPDWVMAELAARAAENIRSALTKINLKFKLHDSVRRHPMLEMLEEAINRQDIPHVKKKSNRGNSVLDYYNKELVVGAVLGVRKSGIRGFDVFIVVQHYLKSIGIKRTPSTIEKNLKAWQHGAAWDDSYSGFWMSEVGSSVASYRRGVLEPQ